MQIQHLSVESNTSVLFQVIEIKLVFV